MENQIKILHLEDNELDSELLLSTLIEEGVNFTVNRVINKQAYIYAIKNNLYDLILSDNTLPDFDGIDALRLAKNIQPQTPFIFVSGTLGEDVAIEAMRWGASDYVLKHKISKLGLTVKRVLQESRQKKELEIVNEKIKESEEKYRIITENSADAIFVVNNEGKYVYVNSEVTNLLGYGKEEMLTFTIRDLAPKDKMEEYYKSFMSLFQTGKLFAEIQLKKKTDELISVDINAVVLPNGLAYASCRDITERKNVQNEILKAKEKAEEMNRLKSYFLSNMSHELRTPMIAIMGYAELLQNEITDSDQLLMIEGILEGASRLNSTFLNILELSEIESSSLNLSTSLRNLSKEVEESINPLYIMAARKKLYLKVEVLDIELQVDIDPILFRDAIYQIVDNAIKFTKKGGILIQIDKYRKLDQFKAMVRITDTGVGISQDDILKIFGEFRQASEGMSRAYEGLGVGLSLVKKILEMMNGEINIESEIGKGTTITLVLPQRISTDQFNEEIAVRRKTTIVDEYPMKKKNKPLLLLIEDNPSNRIVIKLFLKNHYDITETTDGISALVIASRIKYDVVLMDINLGEGINGIETMQRLREMKEYENVYIIAVTAYAMYGDREKFLNMGFDGYLSKPFKRDTVLNYLKNILNRK